ncbi:acyltransferase family protein [Blastococcus goldschmidtiae]|uniref:Acyltransferase family protein n=1 Tax=Blastococcus goldschmidtiae TaxID=3075546 RepID=A0ABU2K4D7_9ACTN|nr:acyltransferase family protein [Blastococcus sp. DSM 46792]MDT0275043.1 acyltransferase family protein [Blastococcus sp. DSM 46792]
MTLLIGTATAVAPPAPVSPARTAAPAGATFRADIQGLRAVAVGLVVLYHLWPNRLTGGFVGVDVFFVISGFLITSHLWMHPPGSARDLAQFWARRVRRLLPASLLVLAATAVATRVVAPETQWAATAREIIASALYVQNWQLASTSVDYLLAGAAASPVQHFWSLSVEEQFYLLWPVFILLMAGLAAWTGLSLRVVGGGGVALLVVASLAYSIHATATEPAAAYFVTPARIWEMAAGGLLALAISGRSTRMGTGRARIGLAWLGYATIGFAALTYSAATPFPGVAALLPVLGAVAVLAAAAPEGRFGPGRVLHRRPVQGLGDWSYSVYLWHWPLIVLLPHVSGGHLGRLDKVTVLVLSVVLAGVTKRLVEDRWRNGRRGAPLRRTFAVAAAGMAVVLAVGAVQLAEVSRNESQAREELLQAISGGDPCFGAAAMAPDAGCGTTDAGQVVPAPAHALDDRSEAYGRNCFTSAPFTELRQCVFGDPDGDVSIALVGNSHAGHWLPALQTIAERRSWRITTFLASECTISTTPVQWDSERKTEGCLDRSARVVDQTVDGDFDLVVVSERNGRPAVGHDAADSHDQWVKGYRGPVAAWSAADLPVLVLHDTATPGATLSSVPDCIAANPEDFETCSGPRGRWVPEDPLVQAAREQRDEDIAAVDLNDMLCEETTCHSVIGGVLVYYDASHMTATFSRTLAPYLEPALAEALAGAGRR